MKSRLLLLSFAVSFLSSCNSAPEKKQKEVDKLLGVVQDKFSKKISVTGF